MQAFAALANDNALTRASTHTTNRTALMLAQALDQRLCRWRYYTTERLRDELDNIVSTLPYYDAYSRDRNILS